MTYTEEKVGIFSRGGAEIAEGVSSSLLIYTEAEGVSSSLLIYTEEKVGIFSRGGAENAGEEGSRGGN